MDVGSEHCLAFQNLLVPEDSLNRTIPEWLFPSCFSSKDSLPVICTLY